MLNISLNDFLKLKDVRFVNIPEEKFSYRHIKDISIDSRTIESGQIFWAIKGERFDGHDFVRETHMKSALCAVIQADHFESLNDGELPLIVVPDALTALQELARVQRNKYMIPVIAITGSNGKTTTKEMIAQILQTKINVHKTKGNLNNQIGCPLTMLQLNELHEAAILELGTNQFGEIDILSKTARPTHALITLIGDTHLEYLESREGVAREKLSLFDNLQEDSTIYRNLDDPFVAAYKRDDLRYITYSFEHDADVNGEFGTVDENGCGSLIVNKTTEIRLKVPGLHNVRNALAAVTVGIDLGFSILEIKNALQDYAGFERRMQIVKWNDVTILNDAYNANPASMILAIDTILSIEHEGRVFLAIGNMNELGEQSHQMHVDILDYCRDKKIDEIFVIGDKMQAAANDAHSSLKNKLIYCSDLNDLAARLTQKLSKGDVLLLKGSRSMQMEKVMAFLP